MNHPLNCKCAMLGITIAPEGLANYINVEDLQANLRSIVELLSLTNFVVQSQQFKRGMFLWCMIC